MFILGYFASKTGRKQTARKRNKATLRLDLLEGRDVPSATAIALPDYVMVDKAGTATPLDTAGPTGLTPTQIRAAYGFNQLSLDGTGTTIAIVDAYDDPTIASDLHQFDVQFGLPDPTFTKVSQTGSTTALPAANAGWSDEISLDVEWAHVIAPGAKILLVEATDDSFNNLTAAVQYAAKQPNVVAVSMSWGGGEFNGETSYDSVFTTPAGHTGVTFVASSGDDGAPISYPAASPNVLSVGGTTLNVTGTITSETAWSGSGGGTSAFEAEPSYQKSAVTATGRDSPDVSYDADPNTGFPVYDSYDFGNKTPWAQFGGTSDAAPQWAGLIALADEGRINAGLTPLNGTSQTLPMIYALSASDFHDITSGASTGSPHISAAAGYDRVTGRGSPIANKVVADLVGAAIAPPAPSAAGFTLSAPLTSVAGNSISVVVTALGSNGAAFPSFLGSVSLSSSDVLAGLPASYTFTAADKGTHTFTVTLDTAGADSITATSGSTVLSGSDNVTVSPAAASKLAFSQQPSSTTAGSTLSIITVRRARHRTATSRPATTPTP